jgi:2-methylisocitrate lyase-like PEP mutase family enzyme
MSKGKILRMAMSKGMVVAPFIFDGGQALFVEKAGFSAAYMTGFGTAAKYGLPDVGLLTLTEMADNVRVLANSADIPIIADADTGYGNYSNVMRTVQEYERAGAGALHLEDQVWPKRCGYLANKQVIPKDEATSKIKAAVDARRNPDFVIIGRTDALAVNGWDDAEDRARSYAEAGADVVFVDGIRTADDFKEYKRRLGNLHILFNNVPLLPLGVVNELGGAAIVIHPGPWMCSGKVFDEELRRLKKDGVVSLENPFDYFIKAVDVLGAEKYFKLDNHYKDICK